MHVAFGGAYLHLSDFRLRHMRFRLHILLLFLLFVLELAVIGYLGYRWIGIRGYLYEVKAQFPRFRERILYLHDAEILAFWPDYAPLARAYTLVHPNEGIRAREVHFVNPILKCCLMQLENYTISRK